MKNKSKKLITQTAFALLLLHISVALLAQPRLRISLLTCSPGQELSETFGHSALRVIDSNSVVDNVYNYGTFPFYEPGFYIKFIRGKLKYSVEAEPYYSFISYYQLTNRGVTEQVLNLTTQQKIDMQYALLDNIKEANKYYQYDFFLDNCTTRLRDIIEKYTQPKPVLPAVMPPSFTFRNAIHQYLHVNNKPWSKLGIDLLLGANTDAVMTTAQQQFLPDNLMFSIDKVKNVKMVATTAQLFVVQPTLNKSSIFTPLTLSIFICLVIMGISLFNNAYCQRATRIIDKILFMLMGILAVLLFLMWVATNHSMTKDNYNLLWASPLYIGYSFFLHKKTRLAKKISAFVFVYLLLLMGCWFFLPQALNIAFLPLVALLTYRSFVNCK